MSAQTLPYAHLGKALATDYFFVREQFSDEEWDHFIATRRFVDNEVLPPPRRSLEVGVRADHLRVLPPSSSSVRLSCSPASLAILRPTSVNR